ncbi:hypothetical protein [uncultured Arcobacter sp.]|uniref:hypothetical protein n=1 Tax=uncultured Arcobacter sp. TaxID=165434 RepID=UPI0026239F90|nr:hypothetical protein [uncultured Arcobacter sp.]
MAENQEKTEAELLEEAMQNLGLEEVVDEGKAEETLVEGAPLSDEDIESLIKEDEPEEKTQESPQDNQPTDTVEKNDSKDEISDVDDINLNNSTADEIDEIPDNSVLKDEEFDVQKKQSKIVRSLIVIVSILLTFVSIGVLLYFVGFFDSEPVKTEIKPEVEKTQKAQKDEYEFKEADIDANRLNKKLNLLTKYEIVENSATEEKKAIEKENLYLEAKKQLEMERQAQIERIKEAERKRLEMTLPPVQKEEDISQTIDKEIEKVIDKEETPAVAVVEVDNSASVEEKTKDEEVAAKNDEQLVTPDAVIVKVDDSQVTVVEPVVPVAVVEPIIEEKAKSQFVKIIKIATKSQDIYKSFLDKIYSVSDNVTLCRDYQNNVEIFIGPFDDDSSRDKITKEYESRYNIDAQEYDYTIEEYDERCNY